MSARVFVGNLNYQTTKEELSAALSEAGTVMDVYIPTDRDSGRPRGFAFVQFSSEEEAAEAIRLFNQREVGGRKLNVNEAEERPRRGGGGGPRRNFSPMPPPEFDAFDGGGGMRGGKPSRKGGSRRGLRARKRSL